MRFLFLCLLFYLGYRVIRGFFAPTPGPSATRSEKPNDMVPVDDVMVKDPFCQTYIPKRDGIRQTIDGKTVFFCSTQCRDKYLDGITKDSGTT
jgi:YHS domain-containing protein